MTASREDIFYSIAPSPAAPAPPAAAKATAQSAPEVQSYAALVATPDWPWRLVAAARVEFWFARASGDAEDIEFWGAALAIAAALYRRAE